MRTWTFQGWGGDGWRPPAGSGDGCARCGAGGPLKQASVVPFHKGGQHGPRNRQWLCRECLRLKRAEDQ